MKEQETNEEEKKTERVGEEKEEQGSGGFSLGASIGIAVVVIGLAVAFFMTNMGGAQTTTSSSSSSSSSGSTGTSATSGEGSDGVTTASGTFRMPLIGSDANRTTYIPWKNLSTVAGLMHRALFLADSSFEFTEPDLAESLEISEDSLTYTIQLKEGIKWSDGVDFTMDDVLFSFDWILLSEAVNGVYTTAFVNIVGAEEYQEDPSIGLAGVTAEGNTLTIQLSAPYPALEQVLAQFTILPKHALEGTDMLTINDNDDYWLSPVVNGMYQVGTVDLTDDAEGNIALVQNEYYEGTKPQIENIVFTTDNEVLDYYSTNNINDVAIFRAMSQFQEYDVDVLFYCYLIFNMSGVDGVENVAMQDPLVREAISYAIDREELLRDIYLNTGAIVDTGVPRSHTAYVGSEVSAGYDPEKAKELLAESSYNMSTPLRLAYYNSDEASISLLESIATQLEEVGFIVDLRKLEAGSELYNERQYDVGYKRLSAFSLLEWYAEYDDDNPNFKNIFGGTTAFEPLINSLASAVDVDEIDTILTDLQYLEDESQFKVPLFTLNHYVFINKNTVNIPSGVSFGNTFYRHNVNFEEWSMK